MATPSREAFSHVSRHSTPSRFDRRQLGSTACSASQVSGLDDSVLPESRLKIYSDLFDEVIERDRVFGTLLRKIKAAYDVQLMGPVDTTMDSRLHGSVQGAGIYGDTSSFPMSHPCSGCHSAEPTTRAEDGATWEVHRENQVLKDLVERLYMELEEASQREQRLKEKVTKLKARSEPEARALASVGQACGGGGHLHVQTAWGSSGYQDTILPPKKGLSHGASRSFQALRREPSLQSEHESQVYHTAEGQLNQGGLLSLSSISPQHSGLTPAEGLQASGLGTDSARSDDSGMLPQRPTRRAVVRPPNVPVLDLSRLQNQLEEDEEEEEEGLDGEHMEDPAEDEAEPHSHPGAYHPHLHYVGQDEELEEEDEEHDPALYEPFDQVPHPQMHWEDAHKRPGQPVPRG